MLLFDNSKFKINFNSGSSLYQNSATYSTNYYYPRAIQHLLKTYIVREDKQLVLHRFVTSIFHCCAIRLLISITIYFSFILQYSIINPSCSFKQTQGCKQLMQSKTQIKTRHKVCLLTIKPIARTNWYSGKTNKLIFQFCYNISFDHQHKKLVCSFF